MSSIIDDRGFNQGFTLTESTQVRMKRRADWMVNKMDLSKPREILEIGCGTGEVAFWIASSTGHNVLSTDICLPFIEQAKEKYQLPNLSYAYLNFFNIQEFENKRFDYIIGNGILHHLYMNIEEALKNLQNLLKPGGAIIFIEPNIYNPYCSLIFKVPIFRKMAKLEPDEMAFSKKIITTKLKEVEFKNITIDYVDFLLPGIPSVMIKPSIVVGDVLEKIPLIKLVSQSLFIYAIK